MKEKIFNTVINIITLFVLMQLLINRRIVYLSVIYALDIWLNCLLPSLFPFFIVSDILINYNIINYIPNFIKKGCKQLFNINESMLTILILSMFSGFPSNAKNTRQLYDKRMISLEEANHILIFSHFANPIFIFATIGGYFFNNQILGIILLGTHYLSNIIIGICFRDKIVSNESLFCLKANNSFGSIFISAIKKAVDTILTICGIVVIFLILSNIIISTFNISNYNAMLIKGIFEISIGIKELSTLSIMMHYKAVIASMFLAFGGISVHMQVISQIVDTKINYKFFLVGRIYQMLVAGILTYIICLLLGI